HPLLPVQEGVLASIPRRRREEVDGSRQRIIKRKLGEDHPPQQKPVPQDRNRKVLSWGTGFFSLTLVIRGILHCKSVLLNRS
ncbi:hypothetical protein ACD591_05660, partial [Rufibacter glacialis]